jgi:hypothetical protein
VRLADGSVAEDSRLGRLIQFDERSRQFSIRATLTTAQQFPRSYTWGIGPATGLPHLLDQGQEGSCTGFSVTHEAAARPKPVQNLNEGIARSVYLRAKELDDWPGSAYEGSSVLGAMKAGQERGWYSEYRWAFGTDDALLAIGHRGPGILGTWWYEDMMDTDAKGFIHAQGQILGGHAILVNGVSVKGRYVKLVNSWSEDWGVKGTCKLSFEDFDRLLHEDGEFSIPVIRKV